MPERLPAPPSFALGGPEDTRLHAALPEDATVLWFDSSGQSLYVWGDISGHRLHTAEHPLGKVAIIGDCFTDDETLQATLTEALAAQQPELLTHFPGSYLTILQEPGQTTVLKDVAGTFPAYFSCTDENVIVSSLPSVAAGGEGLRPNPTIAAANLVLLGVGAGQLTGNESTFEGIGKLNGGQAITLQGNERGIHTYEPLIPQRNLTLEAAADNFRDALIEAVQARLDHGPKPSANLSGGKDSTAIVSLILDLVGNETLPVFFMHNPSLTGGDLPYFKQFIDIEPRLSPTYFNLHGLPHGSDASGLHQGEELHLAVNPARWSYLKNYYASVRETGAGAMHFTGNGGDEVASIGMNYLPNLLRRGEFARFLKEGTEWARIYNTAPYKMWIAMGRLAFSGPAGSLRRAARAMTSTKKTDIIEDPINQLDFWRPDSTGMQWLTDEARANLRDFLMQRAGEVSLQPGIRTGDFIAHERLRCAAGDQYLESRYTPDVSLQSPFLDNNVVRAAFVLAAEAKGSPYEFKAILQRALEGIFPQHISERTTKGVYDFEVRKRHFQALRTLGGLLEDSQLVQLNIIRPEVVRQTINNLETAPPAAMWALTQLLVTELWLRDLARGGHTLMPLPKASVAAEAPKNADNTPLPDGTSLTVPDTVYAVAAPDASLILFNTKTNSYHPLNLTESYTLRFLAANGNVTETFDWLQTYFPKTSRKTIEANCTHTIRELLRHGLIIQSDDPTPRTFPFLPKQPRFVSEEFNTARGEETRRVPFAIRATATVALIGTTALGIVAPQKRRSLLKVLQDKWCAELATQEEAMQMSRAVQTSRFMGRLACLRASYATAFGLGIRRRKVDWHVGVSTSPLDIHAWNEAEGKPVRTPYDGRVTGNYQSIFD